MRKRILPLLLTFLLAAAPLSGCGTTEDIEPVPAGTDESVSSADASADPETLADEIPIVFSDNGVTVNGRAVETDGGELTLENGGVYRVSGTAEGRLVVDAADTEAVTLILDGCDLTWADDEVIYVKTADSARIVLADGSDNVLVSGDVPDEDAVLDEEASGAALRAKCPTTITGGGFLEVYGYINNGIASTGDITVEGGVITVTAVNDGLKSKANVTIRDGILTVNSDMDGIQADGELTIHGGTITVHTGAGSDGADMKVSDSLFMGMGGPGGRRGQGSSEASGETDTDEAGSEAERSESSDEAEDGAASPEPSAPAENDSGTDTSDRASGEMGGMPWDKDDEDSPSRKGLKAAGGITISGGCVMIDAEDDAIHSDGDVTLNGGEILDRSGDDGVHADARLIISDGILDVQYCYEGLEAKSILIEGGSVNVAATDDGMNVNGGSGFGFPSGEASGETEEEDEDASDEATEDDTGILRITGGTVVVDSGGDGLDSNGSVYIEGGTVYVSGPSSNWDAAIDCGEGSSVFVITGGIVMAGGYSGMAEAPDTEDDSQPSIYYVFADYADDGALCTLKDADGNILLSYSFVHGYNCVVLSSPDLAVGETYTLSVGDQQADIELTGVSFSNRTRGGFGGFGSREASGEADSGTETEASGEIAG